MKQARWVMWVMVGAMLLTVAAPLVTAHGNQKHVFGTVAEIEAASVTVTTGNGKVTVKVLPETSFVKSGMAAHLSDLKVGDRVVIHAIPKGTALNATEVKFGAQSKEQPMVMPGDLKH